jgi:homocysteine S-methyltransferase
MKLHMGYTCPSHYEPNGALSSMDPAAIPFSQLLATSPVILGEGAIIERLRRMDGIDLHPHVVNSALIYEEAGHAALTTIYHQYLETGRNHDLPLLLSTPTWRASKERIQTSGLANRDLNGDNFRFLHGIRREYGEYARKVAICGLMSCRGDAYRPEEALSVGEAEEFHAWQAHALAEAGVDLLLASTLPALGEAIGLARVLAATALDAAASPPPLAYLINCTHASFFRQALLHEVNSSQQVRNRVAGLLANTAAVAPEDLDNSTVLREEEPEAFGRSVALLHKELGMKILGGCCGTDDRHIRSLARELTNCEVSPCSSGKSFSSSPA